MSKTKILKCTCNHKFQDKKYGKKKRVHNRIKVNTAVPGYRCTVCGDEK